LLRERGGRGGLYKTPPIWTKLVALEFEMKQHDVCMGKKNKRIEVSIFFVILKDGTVFVRVESWGSLAPYVGFSPGSLVCIPQ